MMYANAGDFDAAFRYIEQALEERDAQLFWIKAGAAWDVIHDDPRFPDVVRRLGLPP